MLLVAAYWRTNLTLRQLAPLFGVSKSSAERIVGHLGALLALLSRKRFRKDTGAIVSTCGWVDGLYGYIHRFVSTETCVVFVAGQVSMENGNVMFPSE